MSLEKRGRERKREEGKVLIKDGRKEGGKDKQKEGRKGGC
jgi:hypothetical protein